MSWLLDWIMYQIPWYVQTVVFAIIVGIPIYMLACMMFGTQVTNRYVVHGVILVVTLGLASKLRQEGYRARMAEEERSTKRAEDVAAEERREAEGLPDVALNDKVDKWTRP